MSQSILYVNNTDPEDGGGGDLRMFEEAKTLAERGWDAKIITSRTDPEQPKHRVVEGVQIRTIRCMPTALSRFSTIYFYLARSAFPILSLPVLLQMFWQNEFDIVVDNHTPHPSLAPLIGILFPTPMLALVHEFHDWTALRKYPLPVGLIQLVVQHFLQIGLYNAVIVPREQTRDQLQSYGVTTPIYVIPNGIEFEDYRDPPESVNVQSFDFLLVSRLVHRKGIDLLLEAMAIVVHERPDSTLGIAGSGPKQRTLEQQCHDLGIEDNVEFLGYVSEERKIGYLHEATVFTLPSRQEGFGIAVLEALAAGLPIVANDLDILRDLVPEAGNILVDANNPNRFAQSMINVIDMDETNQIKLSETNQIRAQQYSWAKIGQEADNVYNQFLLHS